MSLFETSTQRQHWSLSWEEIRNRRVSARQVALNRLNRRVRSEVDGIMPLSTEEEELLRVYHERRILRIVKSMRLPTKTAATAVTYFKRFFLTRDLMEYNPNVIA